MKAPIVQKHMTRLPRDIERIGTVSDAKKMMDDYGIRHVPVMSGLQLKGIISQRDILAASIRLGKAVDGKSVDEICVQDVLTVSPLTPIDQVAQKMLERRVGSAVVVDGGYVVGMFTSVDALKTLAQLFRSRSAS